MKAESQIVRDVLNSIGTIKFRVDEPGEDRLLLKQQALWFVWSTSIRNPHAIGPLKAAWEDRDGSIWLETSEIDDMMSLVERDYGEKGIHEMPDVARGVVPIGDIPGEVAKFPRVVSRLKDCEGRVAEISRRSGIPLKVLYDGGAGVITFRIGAKIISPPNEANALQQRILATSKVLRETYNSANHAMSIDWDEALADLP